MHAYSLHDNKTQWAVICNFSTSVCMTKQWLWSGLYLSKKESQFNCIIFDLKKLELIHQKLAKR